MGTPMGQKTKTSYHCAPVTDVTGAEIPRIGREIPDFFILQKARCSLKNRNALFFNSSRRDTTTAWHGQFRPVTTGFHLLPGRFHPALGRISFGLP